MLVGNGRSYIAGKLGKIEVTRAYLFSLFAPSYACLFRNSRKLLTAEKAEAVRRESESALSIAAEGHAAAMKK